MDTHRRRISRFGSGLITGMPEGVSRERRTLLPALGRAADHSVLWVAVAAGFGLSRNRRTRRAALRGLAAIGTAGVTVKLAGKPSAWAGRPAVELAPLARLLRRAPTGSSSPSRPTASAAAFATSVALEHPLLAVPVGALAVGVGASQVIVGKHRPSDVVAGAAIGVAAGLATTRWWATVPSAPADAPEAIRAAPALPTGRGLVAVVNTAARGADTELADRLAELLPDAEIIAAEGEQAAKALADAADRAEVLGVAGGDGTVNTAARLAADKGIPLLVIPAGTLNHFARDLGVEDVDQAVRALRAGEAVEVDAGLVGDDVFMNTFSIGAYVDLVDARQEHEARLGKWPAMVLGTARVLRHGSPTTVRVDGRTRRIWLLFAGNCRYEPAGLAPTYRPRLADGDLDIRIVDGDRPYSRLRLITALATGTLPKCPVYEYRAASTLTLESLDGEPLDYAVDGESCAGTPHLSLRKLTGRIVVYRPAD